MRSLKAVLVLAALLALVPAASASATVKWWTKAQWGPATLKPGAKGEVLVYLRNYGSSDSSGPIQVVDQLPSGVVATGTRSTLYGGQTASCSGINSSTVACTVKGSPVNAPGPGFGGRLDQGIATPMIRIDVKVSPSATGQGTNTLTVSGGGAANPATDTDTIAFGNAAEEFGITPSSFTADMVDASYPEDASPVREAGAHPNELRLDFDFNLTDNLVPVNRARTVAVTLPRGLIGNPEATPKCKPLDFLTTGQDPQGTTGCPPNTQVGSLDVHTSDPFSFSRVAIYNLEPPKGTPADFGFQIGTFAVGHIFASLDPAHNYAIKAISPYINSVSAIQFVRVTQWGVPADPAHDFFRANAPTLLGDGNPDPKLPNFGAHFTAPIKPFFTNPSDCGFDNGGFEISGDSWANPGRLTDPLETSNHLNVSGCDDQRIRFHPDISLNPTSRAAGGPTGLNVDLTVPQRDQTVGNYKTLYAQNGDPHGIDTPPIKKAVVTLPEGMTLSTSAAQGLGACTPAQIGIGNNDPVSCPDNSQYGTLTLHTPILPQNAPMHGFIYVAQQAHNPFDNFISLYLVIEDADRGLRVKIPGKVDLDPVTGQITTSFDDLPQFPVSDFQLSLKGGLRAALVNPTTCGSKQISATFYSWADPSTPIAKTSAYDISRKGDGSPCVNSLGDRSFHPELTAGTLSSSAGSYSPFLFRLTRSDDDQEFSQLGVTLPPGLIAKIAGIARCSDAGIAQAIRRTGAGQGAQELGDPSCPASSQLGTSDVGTGVGQVITYVPGKVYLAGPYRGAPLSMVVITPILAGPYDLGVIAVRSALDIDPRTGQAKAFTDPFPQIYQGIPVRLRDIRIKVDRPETMLNPTSCNPMAVTAHVTGTGGDVNSTADDTAAALSTRFKATDCASLGFKPRLTFKLSGGTKRGAHPALRAVLKARPGDANIADTAVTLPKSAFLDQSHIRTVCTRVQFAAHECPAAAIYGHARAITPLLDEPLEGPVYLRSSDHQLPDLVAALNGQIDVEVVGRIDSVKGRIRSSFESIPDAPVSKFVLTMRGAKQGLIVNSRDLCATKGMAMVQMTGHNGKANDFGSKVKADCAKAKKKHKRKGRLHRRKQARTAAR